MSIYVDDNLSTKWERLYVLLEKEERDEKERKREEKDLNLPKSREEKNKLTIKNKQNNSTILENR